MPENSRGFLRRYWPFWGLHFGIHMVIGLLANMAGLILIFTKGEIINGFALIGAGSFAIINGWQGFKELGIDKVDQLDKTLKESNR